MEETEHQLRSPRQRQEVRGKAEYLSARALWKRPPSTSVSALTGWPPTLDTEMFSCPALKTARLQRPAIRDRAVHVGDRLSKVAPGKKGGRSLALHQSIFTPWSPSSTRALFPLPFPGHPITRLIFGGVSLMDLVVKPHVSHCHAVLGEGARLVRADGGRGAQGLHGLQVLHQAVLASHALGCQRQAHLADRQEN